MSKIEWCDITWNPVWGCLNNCKYCYARNKIHPVRWKVIYEKELKYRKQNGIVIPDDLYTNLRDFKPQFLRSQYDKKKFSKKPKRIFIDSMSDINFWESWWLDIVLERIKRYPQHTFILLTKFPEVYFKWSWPKNCWLGISVENKYDLKKKIGNCISDLYALEGINKLFLSIEPINGYIDFIPNFDWVIVGMETGNRKDKIIPNKEWLNIIRRNCSHIGVPLFEKDSLKPIMGENLKREFPG